MSFTLIAEIVVSALLVMGGFFALVGSWGLARLPTLVSRLHGPTKVTTLGVGSCLVASMVYFPAIEGRFAFHELLITLFLFVTAPIAANMIVKAHLHSQSLGRDPVAMDGIAEGLPETGGEAGWSTFDGLDGQRLDLGR